MYSFLKDQHYIWDSGLSGHGVYGPKGKDLKNNVEKYIRYMLQQNDFLEIESPLIYKKEVWEKSGHWDKFEDPVIYNKSGKCFRLDKLLETHLNKYFSEVSSFEELKKLVDIMNEIVTNSGDGSEGFSNKDPLILKSEIEFKSLMMKTKSSGSEAALRPETATATYQNFEECFIYCNKQYPVKVFQVGKSFRNEMTTRHNMIRGREFTQLECQLILPTEMKQKTILDMEFNMKECINYETTNSNSEFITINTSWEELQNKFKLPIAYFEILYLAYKLFIKMGIKEESIRLRQHFENEKAFYALDAWDIEVNLNGMGWTEIAGIHDRGTYDLDKILSKKYKKKGTPNVLELAIGIDRLIYCILDNLFEKKEVQEGKSMLTIPYFLAPIQVAVLPLMKNRPELVDFANDVYKLIKPYYVTEYRDKGSIGDRYLKMAIKGVPYCLTVDFDSLKNNDVTVRDRNTEVQVRIKVNDLINYLYPLLSLANA
jgi:glycyl-tRNA synthetase